MSVVSEFIRDGKEVSSAQLDKISSIKGKHFARKETCDGVCLSPVNEPLNYLEINGNTFQDDPKEVRFEQIIPAGKINITVNTNAISRNTIGSYHMVIEPFVGMKVFARVITDNPKANVCWWKGHSVGYDEAFDFVSGQVIDGSSQAPTSDVGLFEATQDMVWTDGHMQIYTYLYAGLPQGTFNITIQLFVLESDDLQVYDDVKDFTKTFKGFTSRLWASDELYDFIMPTPDFPLEIVNVNEISRRGKNLLDINKATLNENGVVFKNFRLEQGKPYVLSSMKEVSKICVLLDGESIVEIENEKILDFWVDETRDDYTICFEYENPSLNDLFQLEIGDIATPIEPYVPQSNNLLNPYEIVNGYWDINGQFVESNNWRCNKELIEVEPDTRYHLIFKNQGTSGSIGQVDMFDENKQLISVVSMEISEYYKHYYFTTKSNAKYIALYYSSAYEGNKVCLSKGDYEDYEVNKIKGLDLPSGNRIVMSHSVGSNLFNMEDILSNNIVKENGGYRLTIPSSSYASNRIYMQLPVSKATFGYYTIIIHDLDNILNRVNFISQGKSLSMNRLGANKFLAQRTNDYFDNFYLYFYPTNANTNGRIFIEIVEEANTSVINKREYEPYLKDKVWKYSEIGKVDLGSANWSYSTNSNFFISTSINTLVKKVNSNSEVGSLICEKYEASSRNAISDLKVCVQTDGTIIIKDTRFIEVNSFKQSLQGVYLYYELATPTWEDITDTPLGQQLLALETYDVRTTIFECDGEGNLSLDYWKQIDVLPDMYTRVKSINSDGRQYITVDDIGNPTSMQDNSLEHSEPKEVLFQNDDTRYYEIEGYSEVVKSENLFDRENGVIYSQNYGTLTNNGGKIILSNVSQYVPTIYPVIELKTPLQANKKYTIMVKTKNYGYTIWIQNNPNDYTSNIGSGSMTNGVYKTITPTNEITRLMLTRNIIAGSDSYDEIELTIVEGTRTNYLFIPYFNPYIKNVGLKNLMLNVTYGGKTISAYNKVADFKTNLIKGHTYRLRYEVFKDIPTSGSLYSNGGAENTIYVLTQWTAYFSKKGVYYLDFKANKDRNETQVNVHEFGILTNVNLTLEGNGASDYIGNFALIDITNSEASDYPFIPNDNKYHLIASDGTLVSRDYPAREGDVIRTDGVDKIKRFSDTFNGNDTRLIYTSYDNGCVIKIEYNGLQYKWLNADYWSTIDLKSNYEFTKTRAGGTVAANLTKNHCWANWNVTYKVNAVYFFFYGKTIDNVKEMLNNNSLVFEYELASPTTELNEPQVMGKELSFTDYYKDLVSNELYKPTEQRLAKYYHDNEAIYNYVPVIRNMDLKLGLYEVVSGVFYTNEGEGDFTYTYL